MVVIKQVPGYLLKMLMGTRVDFF